MKIPNPKRTVPSGLRCLFTLLAILSVHATAFSQLLEVGVSDTVGYSTIEIDGTGGTTANRFSYTGLSVVPPVIYVGLAQGPNAEQILTGTSLYDPEATWADDQFNGTNNACYVELFYSGEGPAPSWAGTIYDIVSTSASSKTITLAQSLAADVPTSTIFKVRKHNTIASVFGPANEAGLKDGTAGSADQIQIHNGTAYVAYYYKTSGTGGTGWRNTTSTSIDRANTVIRPEDGLYMKRMLAADLSIPVFGAVKNGQTTYPIAVGTNHIGNPYAADFTLGNANLLASGFKMGTSTTGDQIQVWNGTALKTYFYSNGGTPGTGWRMVGSSPATADQSGLVIAKGSSFLIKKKSDSNLANWIIPAQPATLPLNTDPLLTFTPTGAGTANLSFTKESGYYYQLESSSNPDSAFTPISGWLNGDDSNVVIPITYDIAGTPAAVNSEFDKYTLYPFPGVNKTLVTWETGGVLTRVLVNQDFTMIPPSHSVPYSDEGGAVLLVASVAWQNDFDSLTAGSLNLDETEVLERLTSHYSEIVASASTSGVANPLHFAGASHYYRIKVMAADADEDEVDWAAETLLEGTNPESALPNSAIELFVDAGPETVRGHDSGASLNGSVTTNDPFGATVSWTIVGGVSIPNVNEIVFPTSLKAYVKYGDQTEPLVLQFTATSRSNPAISVSDTITVLPGFILSFHYANYGGAYIPPTYPPVDPIVVTYDIGVQVQYTGPESEISQGEFNVKWKDENGVLLAEYSMGADQGQFTSTNAMYIVSGVPDDQNIARFTVTITSVVDPTLTVSRDMHGTMSTNNVLEGHPPVVNAGPNVIWGTKTTDPGSHSTIQLNSYVSPGSTFEWTIVTGDAVLSDAHSLNPTLTFPDSTQNTITLRLDATSSAGLSWYDTISIGLVPSWISLPAVSFPATQAYATLTGYASDDLTVAWTSVSGGITFEEPTKLSTPVSLSPPTIIIVGSPEPPSDPIVVRLTGTSRTKPSVVLSVDMTIYQYP